MRHTTLLLASALVAALTGCATKSSHVATPGYDIRSEYNYDLNRPTFSSHHHYGNITKIYFRDVATDETTGSVLNELTWTPEDTQPSVVRKQVVDVRLKGGDTVSIFQDNVAEFYAGQSVKLIGTGSNARIVAVDAR